MTQETQSLETLDLKLGSHTEKNLRHIQRIGTFWKKSQRKCKVPVLVNSLMSKVLKKRVVKERNV